MRPDRAVAQERAHRLRARGDQRRIDGGDLIHRGKVPWSNSRSGRIS